MKKEKDLSLGHGAFGTSGTGDTSGFGGLVRSVSHPGSSERPYGGYFDDLTDDLERAYPDFADAIERVVIDRGELTLHVKREKLVEVALVLRDKLRFEMCLGVNGVHYPNESGRELHAVIPLLSMTKNQRIRLEVSVPESDPHLPSLVEVWAGSNWNERETFDMFGIEFEGHSDLRRILCPDDWEGYPLRKDYKLPKSYHDMSV